MDSELYESSSYGSQFRSSAHLPPDTMSQGAYMSDGSGYPAQDVTGYQTSSYMETFQEGRTAYMAGQESYSNTVYPESAQRTGSMATSMGPSQDAGAMSQLTNVRSNHYEATFDFDTPHFSGPVSGNSSMFDGYGTSSLRNTSTDHRNPPSPTTLSGTPIGGSHHSNTHVHSHAISSSTHPQPLYCPTMASPPRPMTSYSAESSSSNSSPSSLFPKVHPTILSDGPGFDVPLPSADMNFVYGDAPQHHPQHHRRNPPSHTIITPNGISSIPMSTNGPVNWNSGHNHEVDTLRRRPYSSSSLSPSSATTPTLPATLLAGGDSGRLLPAAGASAVALSQRTPYGPALRRPPSSSVTPPLVDPPSADPGSKSESDAVLPPPSGRNRGSALGSMRVSQDISAPSSLQRKQSSHPTSGARPAAQGPTDIGADGQHHLQPPTKKKKKSKMHTCEICSKKFPRPSGLRTHMNTHNNARPYACGFPGCTRTFGVRSNAKRHLRTHGIVPPPSNTSGGEPQYVVGFSPPVIAPAPAGSAGAAITSDGTFCVTDGTSMANGESKPRVGRTPMFKLRWMPPSLTSRTNAAKLKVVDEATGEVSEDETESEEGDDEGDGSDGDYDGPSGDGFEDERDDGRRGSNASRSSVLASFGGLSMPSLIPLGGAATVNDSSAMAALPSTVPSRSSSYSSLYSVSSTSAAATAGCACPFSPCLSNPCRTLNGASSYTSSPVIGNSAVTLGTYPQTSALRSVSMPDFTMGSLHNTASGTIGSLSLAPSPPSRSMDLGFGGLFGSSGMGVSSLYARRVANALNTGHHAHLLASA